LSDETEEVQWPRGAMKFIDVSYNYPDGREVFKRLSLEIPAEQTVGIVGSSGAGKSNLINML
jgi:ATP-binding cassette subfamily B protein